MMLLRRVRGIVIATALFLSASGLRAQQTCGLAPFLGVTSWTGSVNTTVSGSGTVTQPNGNMVTYSIKQTIQMAPRVGPVQGNSLSGVENATVTVKESFTVQSPGSPTTNTTTIAANGPVPIPPGGVGAVLSFGTDCTYSMITVGFFLPGTTTTDGVSQQTEIGFGPLNFPNGAPPLAPIWNVPLPTSATVLSGSINFTAPALDSFDGGPYPVDVTTSWSLSPTADLDVVVTVPAYSTWRPTAGLDETETGLDPATLKFNFLELQAQLVHKSTGQVVDFSPDQWTFSLVQVSNEPGVVMNWPDETQAGEELDMTFDKQACARPLGCVPIPENARYDTSNPTNAVLLPPDSFSYGSVTILLSPHDWGAWATLNVIATLGGQPILGHLQLPPPLANNPNETDILLPQRQAGSFIADSWKSAHNIPLSTLDEDDTESAPNGDGQSGDGLTLYEEYRGFYMGCTNGDPPPRRKELAAASASKEIPRRRIFSWWTPSLRLLMAVSRCSRRPRN